MHSLIIADDLTGGNAAGVLLAKQGLRVHTYFKNGTAGPPDCDCLICPTDSRNIPAQEAYRRVFAATKQLGGSDIRLYTKRIDTTLRGNLGAETDAMLDVLGDDRTAMVVPCFSSSKRITAGGIQLVDQVPLHLTEAAHDPQRPIHTPVCADLFASQSKRRRSNITFRDYGTVAYLAELIRSHTAAGSRILVFDAATTAVFPAR